MNNRIQSAGADFVMAGGMFAGHDQSGGELIEKDGKKYKLFYGMSSSTAMEVSRILRVVPRIPTVKLKIPGKLFLKSESRTSVTFKL